VRKFFLYRKDDESGVSGTGAVAEGIIFHNGWCAMCWRTEHNSIAFYESIDEVEAIHGHHGKTKVMLGDPDMPVSE
jgi:hypothetical protein